MEIVSLLQNYGEVRINEDMKMHTTFRIGGHVQYACYPYRLDDIQHIISIADEAGLPYKIVGKGSNLLWSDDDLNMIVIFPDRYCHQYTFHEDGVICEAGCSLIGLSMKAMERGLSGLEFASGIPGSVGGAVFMNAGAYRSSMSDIIQSVEVLKDGKRYWLSNEDMKFAYRYSVLKDEPTWVLLRVQLKLQPNERSLIEDVMKTRRQRRLESQPLDMPSAGSTFKNPEQMPAWQCIEQLQLRGYQVGGAQVSLKHCNFIINNGNATAADVLALVSLIQQRVDQELKIQLVMEVEQYQCQTKKNP